MNSFQRIRNRCEATQLSIPARSGLAVFSGIFAVRLLLVSTLVLLVASPAEAVRTVQEHVGANNPEDEGFENNGQTVGVDAGPVFNDMGFDAWEVLTAGVFARYDSRMSIDDVYDIATTGFQATANLRSLGDIVPFPHDQSLSNVFEVSVAGIGQWTLSVGADASGNPTLAQADILILNSEVPIPLDPSVTGNVYHEFRMDYDPNISRTAVEVFVDGIPHGMMETAPNIRGNEFNFGSSDSTAVYDTYWNLARLETEVFPFRDPDVDPIVARHEGANDPNAEGFSGNGIGTMPVFDDMGFDAWNQTDPGAFARYDTSIPALQAIEMQDKGWHAKARLRNLRTDDDPGDLGAVFEVSLGSLGQFTLFFGSDADGNPTLLQGDNCCLGGTPITLDPSITGDGYHLFEMLYNPDASATEVELLVDGIFHGLIGPAANNFGDRITFGTSDSGASASVNWNLVEVLILGDGGFVCDFDGDGLCDIDDIDALVTELSVSGQNLTYDVNGDDVIDGQDLDDWLVTAGDTNLGAGRAYLFGDANLDGSVDVSDFNLWNGSKFTSTGLWSQGDFNADGSTDVSDFNVWNGNKFNSSDGTAAVPEPMSLWLLLCGCLAVLSRRACSA